MNIFVYASMESKINRCKEKAKEDENLTNKELEKRIISIDKNRKKFNDLISNQEWGSKENYNLCINTHFTYKKLIKFTLPTIVMMIFARSQMGL